MKTILTSLAAAVGALLIASTSFGQVTGGVPMVNFVCLEPEPLIEIIKITHEKGPEAGGSAVDKYVENKECWYVSPTPVEVIDVLQENLDTKGKLWAVVAVKPHESTGFTQRLTRYSVMDAATARAYFKRHIF